MLCDVLAEGFVGVFAAVCSKLTYPEISFLEPSPTAALSLEDFAITVDYYHSTMYELPMILLF